MAQSKRPKPTGNYGKRKAVAKQALKKKHISNKSRNDHMREKLDRDVLSLHTLRGISDPRPNLNIPIMDVAESMADLTDILRKL